MEIYNYIILFQSKNKNYLRAAKNQKKILKILIINQPLKSLLNREIQ